MAAVAGLTIEDFEKLPDALARNHELVDGELVDVSGNTLIHNRLRDRLVKLLSALVEQQKLGEVISEQEFDFDGNAHGPDVSFLRPEKLTLFDPTRRVQLCVPDFAIEVVSKNDEFLALMKKARRYRRCGTSEVWILSSAGRDAFVFNDRRKSMLEENELFQSELIPGLSIPLSELFDDIGV
jgi:Uma2 family endonuclease